jgi:dihydrofolate reductase
MGEVVYYVATSLDGYIAAADGGVDWLDAVEHGGEDYGYASFFSSVDLMLMGRRTYDQARGFGPWPYGEVPCRIFTSRALEDPPPGVEATPLGPQEALRGIDTPWNRAWLVGGARLAASFRAAGLIDEYIVSIIPSVLGSGVPLFEGPGDIHSLRLIESKPYPSGVVQVRYRRA